MILFQVQKQQTYWPQAKSFICIWICLFNFPLDHISSITNIFFLILSAFVPNSLLPSSELSRISFTSFSVLSLSIWKSSWDFISTGVFLTGGCKVVGIGGKFTEGGGTTELLLPDKGKATLLFRKLRGLFGATCRLGL